MRIYIKPLKRMCNSRNDFNLNSNHWNSNNNVFFFKMTINWLTTGKTYGGKRLSKDGGYQCFGRRSCHSRNLSIVIHSLPLFFDKKAVTDKSRHKKNYSQTINSFSPLKTNGRKCDFECPIHWTINSDQIKGAYPFFDQKSYIIIFFWKWFLVFLKEE